MNRMLRQCSLLSYVPVKDKELGQSDPKQSNIDYPIKIDTFVLSSTSLRRFLVDG